MREIHTKARPDPSVSEREIRHQTLARTVATESIVLLENDGVLPMPVQTIALYGAGAMMTIKGGTGSGEVNSRYHVSIYEGLKAAGFTITTSEWNLTYKRQLLRAKHTHYRHMGRKLMFSNAADRINYMGGPCRYPAGPFITDQEIIHSNADTCIYVIARQVGESVDRNLNKHDYTLDEIEILNISKVAHSYKNTIVVLNVGGSMDVTSLYDIQGINAIIYYNQQGMEGGHALADILTGKVAPSGCLSSTWPMHYYDVPYAQEYSYLKEAELEKERLVIHEVYKEGIYVGYRYYTTFQVKPRYPFGYGLTYTNFSLDYMTGTLKGSKFETIVRVSNTGHQYAGKKLVQLYLSCPDGKVEREYHSLVAWKKTRILYPGEFQDVRLSFDLQDFAAYDEESASYLLEEGMYVLRVSEHADSGDVCAFISLDQTIQTKACQSICITREEISLLQKDLSRIHPPTYDESKHDLFLLSGVELLSCIEKEISQLELEKQELSNRRYNDDKLKRILTSLQLDDMIQLVCGAGILSSDNRYETPGAAGHTTSKLIHKGIHNVTLCDGPSGLRVQNTAVILKSGKIKSCGPSMEFMEYLPNMMKRRLFADPSEGTAVYQYCTAFPVGTALAQTWNTELIKQVGDAIGTEMQEYGVTYWLAPGLNIQRNPLCGRNYEYFSEDPVLSGAMAQALIQGVQSHTGCYATAKHFVANNSEYKRCYSNSIMTERTLREIYLKGFQITVEKAKVKSVMTSYNKVNYIYTSNHSDLLQKVLRQEWGFDGVVMTDWFATAKGLASDGKALRSGNDLIMPGGSQTHRAIKQDLKDGIVSIADVKKSCINILRQILESNHYST